MKKPTLRSLKNKAWKMFSQYIRRKDADEGGTTYCYTCLTPIFWKEAHCGHFVPGRTNSVLLNEEAVRVQCPICNIWRGGAYHDFTLRMIDEVGREKVEELLSLRHQTKKYTRSDLEVLIDRYKQKLAELDQPNSTSARMG